jgi:hypothetical protein
VQFSLLVLDLAGIGNNLSNKHYKRKYLEVFMQKKIIRLFLAIALFLSFCAVTSAEALIVYGKGFSFKVTEPSGWYGVTANANRYMVNVYFPQPGHDYNSSPVLMYVRVMNKNGNTVQRNLELDMDDFSQRKKKVEVFDYTVNNLNYEYAAKKYIINDNQTDYLCYIDPAADSPNYVIFVLTGPKDTCDNYLVAFVSGGDKM